MTHRLHLAMVSVGLAFVCGASLVLAADQYVPMNNQNGKARAWYVGIPVNGNVCGAQITMKDGNEAVAKSIAMSLKAK